MTTAVTPMRLNFLSLRVKREILMIMQIKRRFLTSVRHDILLYIDMSQYKNQAKSKLALTHLTCKGFLYGKSVFL